MSKWNFDMRANNIFIAAIVAIGTAGPVAAQDTLTGDTRLACEALLCLASGTRPPECTPALTRYFSISYRRFSDTLRARANFLNLCPASRQTTEMQAFTTAVVNGAGQCDAATLNAVLVMWSNQDTGVVYISDQLPDYCAAYIGNKYSNLGGLTPKYVGVPERGGYWVAARDYDAALAAYRARYGG